MQVMGIVNATPDSFSDGGRYLDASAAVAHGLRLRSLGADIVDVGGESTRPGAGRVNPADEQARILPVVRSLAEAGVVVSIDTMHASTALVAIRAGATIVNDVSGGLADPDLFGIVADSSADIVIGHWRGHSDDMYAAAEYDGVVPTVIAELGARVEAAVAAGIPEARIVLDPGIGFGKRGAHNWAVLAGLDVLVAMGPRVLLGTSRKGFFAEAIGPDAGVERRDLATAVTSVLAAQAGVWGVRVHDVTATRDALAVLAAVRAGEDDSRD